MNKMIHLTINGKACTAPDGATILEAAKANDIHIPNLCFLENVHQYGACRICVVEVEGAKNLQASCMVKAGRAWWCAPTAPRCAKARQNAL